MSPTGNPARAARFRLETDRMFGIDFLPVGDREFEPASAEDSAESGPAPASVPFKVPPPASPVPTAAPPPKPAPPAARKPAARGGRTAGSSKTSHGVPGPPPVPGRSALPAEPAAALEALREAMTAWVESSWPRDGWTNVVFGEGDPHAKLVFVGEGPGADEDRLGRPFVGRAGQLLDKQIAAMGLAREQVYIANIARTRPPNNRVPTPDEAAAWLPWLERQIEILGPDVIVSLGATSAKYLLGDMKLAITRQRGQWKKYGDVDLLPTFHPAYLLRQYTVENRRRVWDDLCKVLERLGLEPPKKA